MDEESSWTRVNRRCPHCGVRAQTLGSACPACGKSYAPLGLLERLPFMDDFGLYSRWAGPVWVIVGLWLVAGFVYLFVQNWVAGTIVAALIFVGLVAAIGITNWMAER